jgi:uncharacterized RDD family membrane protein YckC
MRSLSLGQAILIVALCAMLALVVVGIVWVSDATNGVDDVAMDENGWIALWPWIVPFARDWLRTDGADVL